MKSSPRRSPIRNYSEYRYRGYRITEKDSVKLRIIKQRVDELNTILNRYSYVVSAAKRFGSYKEQAALVESAARRINDALAILIP